MVQRIQRLEREIRDLEQDYYARTTGGPPPAFGAGETNQASMSVKLNELENSLRHLTGQIEELNYRLKRNEEELAKLSRDIDYMAAGEKPPSEQSSPMSSYQSTQPGTAQMPPVDNSAPQSFAPGVPSSFGTGATIGGNSAGATSVGELAPGETSLGTVSDRAAQDMGARANSGFEDPAHVSSSPPRGNAVMQSRQAMVGGGAQAQYDSAMAQLRRQDYPAAEQAFSQFLVNHPDDGLAGNAQYWLGETFYVRQIYDKAAVAFLQGYRDYPNSAKAPDSLLKLAMTLNLLGEKKEACLTFDEFRKKFSNAQPTTVERANRERAQAGCA
jgi:tol-pal system protein YbgF